MSISITVYIITIYFPETCLAVLINVIQYLGWWLLCLIKIYDNLIIQRSPNDKDRDHFI